MSDELPHLATQRVMVAIDASEISENAFHFYLDQLHRPGNQIIFAHVTEPPYIGTGLGVAGYGFVSGAMYEEMIGLRREDVRTLRDHYVTLMQGKDVKYKVHAVEFGGNPGEALVKIAHEEEVDLVVIGTRGLGKIRRTVLGSVSDYVVHHVHCPVMIYHNAHHKSD